MHIAFSHTIASFALHALWQAPLLGGAAALAIRMGKPQARLAYAIWTATLLLCVLMPVGATLAARRAALRAESAATSVIYFGEDFAGTLPEMDRVPAWQRVLHRHVNLQHGVQPFAVTLPARLACAVSGLYLLIALSFALRLLFAWRRSNRLVAAASELPSDADIAHALLQQSETLGMPAPPVRISDEVTGPALAGVFRPTLLLPTCAAEMTPAEMQAVLAHELAHLRRRDPPVHLLCSVLLVLVGFHPVALWIARRVRQTREMACDAEAAVQMGSAARYAHALLQIAERTGAGDAGVAGRGLMQGGLGLFNTGMGLFPNSLELTGGAMEERMRMMMNSKASGTATERALRCLACVAAGGVAVFTASMLQVQPALAQQHLQPIVVAEPATDHPAEVLLMNDKDEPQLLGGAHAQDQLRKARRDLDTAATEATTDEERQKIATARAVVSAAQQQLAAAGGSIGQLNLNIDVDGLRALKIDPQVKVQIRDLKIDPQIKILIDKQRVDAEAIRVEIEKHRAEFDRLRTEMQSPEFQAKLRAQLDEAQKQLATAKLDKVQAEHIRADVDEQVKRAVAMLRSGELQQQLEAANQAIARLHVPELTTGTIISDPNPADAQQDKPLKVESQIMAGNILQKTTPVYPPEAKAAKISGAVVLHGLIGETGKVESLQVVSSPDVSLSRSAIDAVSQWVYRPYLLNGQPRAVETTITVNYSFGG